MDSNQVSKVLGGYLLRGWTLMAESCPICKNILLKDKRSNQIYCAICNKYCIYQESQDKPRFDEEKHEGRQVEIENNDIDDLEDENVLNYREEIEDNDDLEKGGRKVKFTGLNFDKLVDEFKTFYGLDGGEPRPENIIIKDEKEIYNNDKYLDFDEYLFSGWSMSERNCTICYTPLLQKEKKVLLFEMQNNRGR